MVSPVTGGEKRMQVAAENKGKSIDTMQSSGKKGVTKIPAKKRTLAKVKTK